MTPTRSTVPLSTPQLVREASTIKPWVSVTYDEPLGAQTTPILDAFTAASMTGTFMIVGSQAQANPTLVQDILSRGHELGDHSWSHPRLSELKDHGFYQYYLGREILKDVAGFTPCLARPPYGDIDYSVLEAAHKLGLTSVKWNRTVTPLQTDPTVITNTVLKGVKGVQGPVQRGDIILLHQTAGDAQALPAILTGLQERGLTSVPVCKLLGGQLL